MMVLKRMVSVILLFALILGSAGCAVDEGDKPRNGQVVDEVVYPLTVVDSEGREVRIEKEPERVIAIGPNITETIYALGEQDKMVGRTDYCDYPEEVKQIDSVGGLRAPNVEKIVALEPDLVMGSTHFKAEVVQKLEALNVKVLVLYEKENFEGVYATIGKVGRVLNAKEKADEVVSEMRQKVREVRNKVTGRESPRVYYVVGFGEQNFTAGKDTFIGQLIETAGGKNAADDVEGWQYSLERLVEKNPDMLICSKYYDAKEGIRNANGYKDLDAVKNNQLYEIDNNLLDRQGPRLADGLTELAKIIHPDAFNEQ